MIGLKIKLDLLQTFISLFAARQGLTKGREVLAADEKKVKKGDIGAYLVAKVNVVLELASKFTFSFKTDDNGDWGYISPVLGFNVKVSGMASLEGDARRNGLSGFFNTEATISRLLSTCGFQNTQDVIVIAIVINLMMAFMFLVLPPC